MMHRHRPLAYLCLCLLAVATPALGQARPLSEIKKLPQIGGVDEAVVRQFIVTQVRKLKDTQSDAVRAGREALINESRDGAQPPAPVYAALYAQLLDEEAEKLLTGNDTLFSKLNTAIAVTRVAEVVNNTKLEKSVRVLLEDKQPEALKIWGLRGAKALLPPLVQIGQHQPLIDRIVSAAKGQSDSSLIVQGASEALAASAEPTAIKAVVKPLLEIAELRNAMYAKGPVADPGVDRVPLAYLMQPTVWQAIDNPQKQQAMGAACTLLSYASAQMRRIPQANRDQREQYAQLGNRVGGSVQVIGELMKEDLIKQRAADVTRAAGSTLDYEDQVKALVVEVKKVALFKDLNIAAAANP